MRPLYFGARFFASGFFSAPGEDAAPAAGSYFGSRHFASNYFGAGFYGPVTLSTDISATLDATEAADTLASSATVPVQNEFVFGGGLLPRPWQPLRFETIVAELDVKERGDTCESTATLGFDPVVMDNGWLLVAA